MKFLHTDLGVVASGSTVRVALTGNAANVRLLDDHNLARYKRGDGYQCYGGHFRQSPARITVPSTGRWHVVVDLGGYVGRVGAEVSVVAA